MKKTPPRGRLDRKRQRKEGRKAGDAPTASDNKSLPYAKEKECVSRPRPKCLKGSKLQLSLVHPMLSIWHDTDSIRIRQLPGTINEKDDT